MKIGIFKILILILILSIIAPQYIFAQIPTRDLDESQNFDLGKFVTELSTQLVEKSAIILGACGGFALADALLDYIGEILGNLLKKALREITGKIKDLLSDIAPLQTSVPVTVRNFSEVVNSERLANTFVSCVDKTLSMYFATIINEIGMSILGWINSGFRGTPLFVSSFRALSESAFDAALGEFIYQFNPLGIGRMFCGEPRLEDFRFILSLYTIQPPPTLNTFRCRLTDVYTNIQEFKQQVQQEFDNPWKLLEINLQNLAFEDINIRMENLRRQRERISAQVAAEFQFSITDGFFSGFTCIEKDENGVCIKRVISHPASINKELILFGIKTPLEEIFRRAQNVQSLKDIPYLLKMWGIVLSNNALTQYINEGLKRNLAKKGVSFTEQTRFLTESLAQSSSNYFENLKNVLGNIIQKAYLLDKDIALSTNLLTSINNLVNKINDIGSTTASSILIPFNEPSFKNYMFDTAIILGISDPNKTSYKKSTAEEIVKNLTDYKNDFNSYIITTNRYINTSITTLNNNYQYDIFTNKPEKAGDFIKDVRDLTSQLSKADDDLDNFISFLNENYIENKNFSNLTFDSSIVNTVSSFINDLQNKVNNLCSDPIKNEWTLRIDYYNYVLNKLNNYTNVDLLKPPLQYSFEVLKNNINDDLSKFNNNSCPSP